MKPIYVFLFILLVGCHSKKSAAPETSGSTTVTYVYQDSGAVSIPPEPEFNVNDSLAKMIHYHNLCTENQQKQNEAEIAYLRSGGAAKYEKLYTEYDKLRAKYAVLFNQMHRKIENYMDSRKTPPPAP